jgi:glycosyltransferase involved in cell wall biosynthesis
MKCSVIVPCRNERRFISRCLDSILANDFPKEDYEVIVADGDSEDGSRELLNSYASAHRNLRIIDNPARTAPSGLNLAIREARGDLILRVDAHATIAPDYISKCVVAANASGADNVGGIMHTHPTSEGAWARAIVNALSHPFGVGNSTFRVHSDQPRYVDTVFGGCYRREVFERIGQFNEQLTRGQDMEFNRRLAAAGGRILLIPDIVSHYYARTDLPSFCRHNWSNGVWAIRPFLYSEVMPVRARHLVPMLFVIVVGSLMAAGVFSMSARWAAVLIAVAYTVAAMAAAAQIAIRERSPQLLMTMPVVFVLLHVLYGLGSLWAAISTVLNPLAWQKLFRHQLSAPDRT